MGKCIIWNFGTESTLSLGVSMPATASPRHRTRLSRRSLPSGTAELRRRIITFYADFNTRLRPIPFPSSFCRSYSVTGFRIVDSSPRYRSLVHPLSNDDEFFPLYVMLLFLSSFRTPIIRNTISSENRSNIVGCRSR